MPIFPGGFGTQITSPSAIDADDAFLMSIDGPLKSVAPAAARGYIDASHYSDLNDQVLNAGTDVTGWTATEVADSGVVQLGGSSPESVKAKIYFHHGLANIGQFWVNLTADQTVGNYVEVAWEMQYNGTTGGIGLGFGGDMRAFVASGINRTGTVNYTPHGYSDDVETSHQLNDMYMQVPRISTEEWSTVRIPLYGMTSVRSMGVTQIMPLGLNNSTRGWVWMRNVRLREATGFDRAVYGAAPGSHIVIPPGYTTAKTQLPIFREQANVSWEDRRI